MKLAIDVGYHDSGATSAGVLFKDWHDSDPLREITIKIETVEPYQPGQFYKRELPCILELIDQLDCALDTIIVDGFVWLSADETPKPGLGAYLFKALNEKVDVVGVAKTQFAGSGAFELFRGNSTRPLFVSSAGLTVEEAVQHVHSMAGEHRIPKLLKRVDQLSRL